MKTTRQCFAITLANTRCKRLATSPNSRFCHQHAGGGGGGGGQKLAKALSAAIPIAAAASELVKVVIEILGPMLTEKRRDNLLALPEELLKPRDFLGSGRLSLPNCMKFYLREVEAEMLENSAIYLLAQSKSPGLIFLNKESIRAHNQRNALRVKPRLKKIAPKRKTGTSDS